MKQSFRITLAALAVVAIANVGIAQDLPSYSLTLDGPSSHAVIGEGVEVDISGEFTASVTESDNPDPDGKGGAQGWSISIAADGIAIDEITDEGTDALAKFAGGFVQAGTTERSGEGSECEGLLGAVQAYVLSFTMPITLDANSTSTIAVLNCSGTGTSGPVDGTIVAATLAFLDGCQGPGQPVGNAVTWDGATVNPEKGALEITIQSDPIPPVCPGPFELQLLVSNAETPDPEANAILDVETAAGSLGSTQVIASIRSDLPGTGVQGWSLSSAAAGGDVAIVGVTTEGTDGAGRFAGGFGATELSTRSGEGSDCEGLLGAVSAVVLSFTMPITLDPVGEESVLILDVEATVESTEPEGEDPTVVSGTISFVDGCQGAGQPVSSVATVDGETREFGCRQSVDVNFITTPVLGVGPFTPCDANNDGDINLADAVYLINTLIRGGDPLACFAAGDCNGDLMTDISDAVSVAHGLFGLGTLPGTSCILIEASDEVEIPEGFDCEDTSNCDA